MVGAGCFVSFLERRQTANAGEILSLKEIMDDLGTRETEGIRAFCK